MRNMVQCMCESQTIQARADCGRFYLLLYYGPGLGKKAIKGRNVKKGRLYMPQRALVQEVYLQRKQAWQVK